VDLKGALACRASAAYRKSVISVVNILLGGPLKRARAGSREAIHHGRGKAEFRQ
jgi:hypothetical protein